MKTLFQNLRFFFTLLIAALILVQSPATLLAFNFKIDSPPRRAVAGAAKSGSAVFAPSAVFSNPASITIADRASGANAPNGVSTPYPSNITVSNLSGTLSSITVTFNNVTLPRTRDNDFIVVAPNGAALKILSDAGDAAMSAAANNVTLTFSDTAASFVPNGNGAAAITTGTYRPTDFNVASPATNDTFPAPAPQSPGLPGPTGNDTLASVFGGINPNGTWSLYAIDDSLGGGASTVAGGWSLDITTSGSAAATSTSLASSLNPSLTTQSVTFTATVTSSSAVATGTVSFTQNGAAIAGCTNVAVNASGVATCTVAAGGLPEGTRAIAATYSGATGFATSGGSLSQVVNSPTVVTGSQFCNNGGITLSDNGAAVQYGSNIAVSNLVGTISKVTVNLNNFTAARTQDFDFLLAKSTGQNLKIISDAGDATAVSGVNLTLDDSAANALPVGSVLTSGTFRPTDNAVVNQPDNFPSPAPATVNLPAPAGTATFASAFNGINPNGTWSLYAVDDALGGAPGSIGGYCLNFTLNRFTTATTVTSSQASIREGRPVTFTATVATTGTGTPVGSVQFFDGATSLGTVALNASGQATLTTSTLPVGTRSITAQYLGATVGAGGGGYAVSTSPVFNQRILSPTAASVAIGGRVLSSDGRPINRAVVTITDANGTARAAQTNPFGYYRFTEVPAGAHLIIAASAKNYSFTPQALNAVEDTGELNFIADN